MKAGVIRVCGVGFWISRNLSYGRDWDLDDCRCSGC